MKADSSSSPAVFSGVLQRSDPRHRLPSRLAISWFNMKEGDDYWEEESWHWTGGVSDIVEEGSRENATFSIRFVYFMLP